jgi:uncharacterized protein YndB with AHSA1/START domain
MTGLTVTLDGETRVIVKRQFAAPPEAVFRAHTEPALLQKWCLGPDGWTMPVCICEPRVGGQIRYEWTNGEGGFHLTGEFLVVDAPHRTVHVERMFLPDPTPDNHVETRFEDNGAGGTLMVMTMTLPSAEVREMMLATGMADGMEASYVRLEGLL